MPQRDIFSSSWSKLYHRMNQIKHKFNFTYFFIYLLYSENGRGVFLSFISVTSMYTRWKWLIPDDASEGVISATPIAFGRGDADFTEYNFLWRMSYHKFVPAQMKFQCTINEINNYYILFHSFKAEPKQHSFGTEIRVNIPPPTFHNSTLNMKCLHKQFISFFQDISVLAAQGKSHLP